MAAVIRKSVITFLVLLMFFYDFPSKLVFDMMRDRNVVDVLWQAYRSGTIDQFFGPPSAWAVEQTVILNATVVVLTAGNSWTVPDDWSDNNKIEVIGGGGGGDSDTGGNNGGGGGGAYAFIEDLDLTAGNPVTYQIGQPGNQNANGTDTFFNRFSGSATTCSSTSEMSVCAKAGVGGAVNNGGDGGLASAGLPASCSGCNNGGTGNGGTGGDRKSVVEGKRGDLGGRRIIKKKKKKKKNNNKKKETY